MVELVHVKTVLRAMLFIGLLIIYSVMYMEPALKTFGKKSTTISQKREKISQLESPVIVFCPDPPFKKSFFKQFGKNKSMGVEKYFWSFDVHWPMVENYYSTAMDVYMNMSYQLGLDWNISVPHYENKTLGFVSLQVGIHNYVDYYGTNRQIETIPIRTKTQGLCYKLKISNLGSYFSVFIGSSIQGLDKLEKINLMIAATDTWQGIVGSRWPYSKVPPIISGSFSDTILNSNTIDIEENVFKYLEGKGDFSECMMDFQRTNCKSIFDPGPKNNQNYCPALLNQSYIFGEIKECLEQKEFKQYSALIEADRTDYDFDPPETAESYFGAKMNLQFMIMSTSNKRNIFEETLIFDDIDLVGSLGGSLGLFVGFSFFGYVTPILEAVFDKVASFFLRINQLA